jgi:glycolate oxidase iron-sulfur subunit
MDSPRGRIDLMRGLRTGQLQMTGTVAAHFDRCLGCMACVTACPSGVRYDILIEETRAYVEKNHARGFWDRLDRGMIFQLFPYPGRLRAMAAFLLVYVWTGLRWLVRHSGILRLAPPRLRQLEALQPAVTPHNVFSRLPERVPAAGEKRFTVALVAGCVQRVFNPGVNEATLRVLAAEVAKALAPLRARLCWLPTVGVGWGFSAGLDPAALQSARRALTTVGGWLTAPGDWGAPPASEAVHRSVKKQFDPGNLLAPGRFIV